MKLMVGIFALAGLLFTSSFARANEAKLQVHVFAAPWCKECGTQLVELQKQLEKLADRADQFEVTVFVCSGESPEAKPTQELADRYGRDLGLKFHMRPDVWKWETYIKYFGWDYKLPAAAVINEEGKFLDKFTADRFSPEAIERLVEEHTEAPAFELAR